LNTSATRAPCTGIDPDRTPPPTCGVESAIHLLPQGAVLYDPTQLSVATLTEVLSQLRPAGGEPLPGLAGRGEVRLIRHAGREWIWRRNRRGGLVGRLIASRYVWLGRERTRVWREWRLLHQLRQLDLPVPRPVAAGYQRHGVFYECHLLTERLPDVESLAARLGRGRLPPEAWADIGRCLARFHAAGVFHADLNAHNILLNTLGEVFLLDFDRGRLRGPGPWRAGNRRRLHRSLLKVSRELPAGVFDAEAWRRLEAAALTGA
jgi:3-deoxy-D-manno-octulosonic acid kinase